MNPYSVFNLLANSFVLCSDIGMNGGLKLFHIVFLVCNANKDFCAGIGA